MPIIIFETEEGAEAARVEFAGGRLADLCDELDSPVPFSCRSANCGTCRVHIVEGGDRLGAAEDEELDVLDIFGVAPPAQRLACQAKVLSGPGTVRVRPVSETD